MAKRSTPIDTTVPEFVSPALRIISARAGFRRGGIAHPAGPTDYPEGKFTVEQILAIEGEPLLEIAPITASLSEAIGVLTTPVQEPAASSDEKAPA
jgi:hypothetical protein